LLALAGELRPDAGDLLPTIAWQKQGKKPVYAIEGGVYDAGSALEWARGIGLYSDLDELSGFECTSALQRGLVFIPALSGLAAPCWDREAAPLFIGMQHDTTRQDLLCAVLEGIAMMTARLIAAIMQAHPSNMPISIDGGLSRIAYFARFLAAASERSIKVPHMHELTALGLAELSGLNVDHARANASVFHPDANISAIDHARFTRALEKARHWRA